MPQRGFLHNVWLGAAALGGSTFDAALGPGVVDLHTPVDTPIYSVVYDDAVTIVGLASKTWHLKEKIFEPHHA